MQKIKNMSSLTIRNINRQPTTFKKQVDFVPFMYVPYIPVFNFPNTRASKNDFWSRKIKFVPLWNVVNSFKNEKVIKNLRISSDIRKPFVSINLKYFEEDYYFCIYIIKFDYFILETSCIRIQILNFLV